MNPETSNDQAAGWAARLDAGPLSRPEAETLMRWLEADPANESRLEEIQLLHQKVRLVLPEMAAAGRLPSRTRAGRFRPWLAWTAGMAAALALAALGLARRPATFVTAAAERQVITLPDGTRAELNARTTLQVRMTAGERWLKLESGELFLTVAKNAARPFIVETPAGKVRVTGTIFNVSSVAPDAMAVVLLEGSVEATSGRQEKVSHLAPGDNLVVGAGGTEIRRLSPAELAEAVAWREGRIVFHDTPLTEALTRFARHHGRKVEIAPAARELALGGRFGLDDLEGFLRDLQVALPVTVKQEPDGLIRIERSGEAEK